MEIKIKKLVDKAVIPAIEGDALKLNCIDITTEVGKDGRLILVYRTGLGVIIPEGFAGIVLPTATSEYHSLQDAAGLQTIYHTDDYTELVVKYKINTTSVPSIFEPGQLFADLILVKLDEITLSIEEVQTVTNETANNEVNESNIAA